MSCVNRYFGAVLGLHLVKLYQMVFREKNRCLGNHLPKYSFVFEKTFAVLGPQGSHLVKLHQMLFREKNSHLGIILERKRYSVRFEWNSTKKYCLHLVKLYQMLFREKNSYLGNILERKRYSVRFVWNSTKKYCRFTLRKLGTIVDHVMRKQIFRSGTRFAFGKTLPNGIQRKK